MISSYRPSRIQEYLDRTIATAHYLVDGAEIDAQGALGFPCQFAHDVGTRSMCTPWYSGMAQGVPVSVSVNSYETTGDTKRMELAAKTLKSFDQPKSHAEAWFHNVKVLENK